MSTLEISPDGRWVAMLNAEEGRIRVVTLREGAEVATVALPPLNTSNAFASTIGRPRWLPGSYRRWCGSSTTPTSARLAWSRRR
jgi:hypothetical protein